MIVRRLVFRLGFRFRLHQKQLPGSPDIVLAGRRKIIFVHGCFWHGHRCKYGQLPKSRLDYWEPKISANRDRDNRSIKLLRKLGWQVLVVWQCQTKDLKLLEKSLSKFLDAKPHKRIVAE